MASMLTADFTALGEQCRALAAAGLDGIHWDVMDGNAVPSLSFGPDIIAACRAAVDLPFEVHVMSRQADSMIDALATAGCRAMVVHPDWLQNPRRALQRIVESGMAAGVALSPGTPVAFARWQLDIIDRILVMSVEPGYGGQRYIPAITEKVAEIADLAWAADRPIIVEVDGGIGPETIGSTFRAGGTSFVIGSALWRAAAFSDAVQMIRSAAASALSDGP
jgi:ribulose-phosphate 3-epimerase